MEIYTGFLPKYKCLEWEDYVKKLEYKGLCENRNGSICCRVYLAEVLYYTNIKLDERNLK